MIRGFTRIPRIARIPESLVADTEKEVMVTLRRMPLVTLGWQSWSVIVVVMMLVIVMMTLTFIAAS